MAATDGGRPDRPGGLVLGLLTDPDLPAELAQRLAGELPEVLAEHLDGRQAWHRLAGQLHRDRGRALGSELESDQAVRAAAYGYRQQERRDRDPAAD